jgi:hypothetical protein
LLPGHARHYIWLDRYEQAGLCYIHTRTRIYSELHQEDPWQRKQ